MSASITSFKMKKYLFCIVALAALALSCSDSDYVNSFKTVSGDGFNPARGEFAWSGYTNWWNSDYKKMYRLGSLNKICVPDAVKVLEQRRIDLATDLGLPFLQMQEGFLAGLLAEPYEVLDCPSEKEMRAALKNAKAVLVFVTCESGFGEKLACKAPEFEYDVPAYQTHGGIKNPLKAFVLKKGSKKIFAVVGPEKDLATMKDLLAQTQDIVDKYDMKRGWFGVHTDICTVTCSAMTPIETMAAGMNEGNSWFVFSGEYERLDKPELERWISESGSGVEAAVGTHSLYDCRDWDGFQEQLLKDNQYEYAKERDARGGYLFRPIQDWGDYAGTGTAIYDGYFASGGNKEIVDTCSMPFVIGVNNPMVLFTPKGEPFSREAMWSAIMDRREVAIESAVEEFTVMGSDAFRRPVQLMMIERSFIENYFGDQVGITARVEGTTLKIALENYGRGAVNGQFTVTLPPTVTLSGTLPRQIRISGGGIREISVDLNPLPEAMGRRSAITVAYDWGAASKKVMAEMDMPQGVAVHKLLREGKRSAR